MTTKTVSPGGGSLSANVPGGSLAVTVPAGDFTSPVEVEVTEPTLSSVSEALSGVGLAGYSAVAGVGIKLLDTNGQPITGSFAKPITVVLRGASLGVAGEKVVEFTGPSSVVVVPATLGTDELSVTLTADPDLAVVNPPAGVATTAPTKATSVNTGLPFAGETDLAFVLLGLGAAFVLLALRRRRRAPTA